MLRSPVGSWRHSSSDYWCSNQTLVTIVGTIVRFEVRLYHMQVVSVTHLFFLREFGYLHKSITFLQFCIFIYKTSFMTIIISKHVKKRLRCWGRIIIITDWHSVPLSDLSWTCKEEVKMLGTHIVITDWHSVPLSDLSWIRCNVHVISFFCIFAYSYKELVSWHFKYQTNKLTLWTNGSSHKLWYN